MKGKISSELPGAENRIASVLKSKAIRSALAERASNYDLAPRSDLEFSSDIRADHLGKSHSEKEDIAFFDTRRVSEAIILAVGRPVLFVRDGIVETAALPEVEKRLNPVRKALVKPISGVGRIELLDHDTLTGAEPDGA